MSKSVSDVGLSNFKKDINSNSFLSSQKSQKRNVKSKTYLYLFLGKIYQYSILLILFFLHDNYLPWINYIDNNNYLANILTVLIPFIIISYFSYLFLKTRNPFEPKLSFPCLTLSTISLYVLLIYIRKFNIHDPKVLYLICLLQFAICLIITLFLFCIKQSFLDIIFTMEILAIIGTGLFCCYFYLRRQCPLLFIIELSGSIVINIYIMIMCVFIYKKDEENYNVIFFAACKCFHWFLVPFLLLGIVFVMIIELFGSSCVQFCEPSNQNRYNRLNTEAQSQPKQLLMNYEEQIPIDENTYPNEIHVH